MIRPALICLFLVTTAYVGAQTTSGRIMGTVLDGSGAIIPGALITTRNVETGSERSVKTNAEGNYVLYPLPPGTYEITATHPGFRTDRLSDVPVQVSGVITRNIKLEVGGVEQQVIVAADSTRKLRS